VRFAPIEKLKMFKVYNYLNETDYFALTAIKKDEERGPLI
jgi:hypothetical protein